MIAGLILAGGRATRMGGVDKPLLKLGERTLLDIVLERLRPQVAALAISANGDPGRYARFGLPVLADEFLGRGPLGGVLSGLGWAAGIGAEVLLTVPGDTPFVPVDLAVWPVSCAAALAGWLGSQPSGRVSAFGEMIGMRRVWFGGAGDSFHNVNTPADLAAARRNV
jgi:molybdopterin-guanine dinucleotide biosynthesis protein A